jgi:hypothetical protein
LKSEPIQIIDLDSFQQEVYNSPEISKQKMIWSEISKEILSKQRQQRIIGSKYSKRRNQSASTKNLIKSRIMVKQKILSEWKKQMLSRINWNLNPSKYTLFLGFNIHPKDYRVKIPIETKNNFIYSTKGSTYASNQIKYYLNRHKDKIVKGTFPLNLLKIDYVSEKYNKFTNYYYKRDYQMIEYDSLFHVVKKCLQNSIHGNSIPGNPNKSVYVATKYDCGNTIPINSRTPIQGYKTRSDAIEAIKPTLGTCNKIYIYKVSGDQFKNHDGKLIADRSLKCKDAEALLLTIDY